MLGWGDPLQDRRGDEQLALQAAALLELSVSVPFGGSLRGELALSAGLARGLIATAREHEAAASHGACLGATLLLAHVR